MATVITVGSVTFTITETLTNGTDEAGVPWVSVPSGTATLTSVTPAETTDGSGDVINGAMLNPERTGDTVPPQGFDERAPDFDSGESLTYPVSLSPGDIVIKAVSRDPNQTRAGYFDEIASLHVLDSSLASGEFLGSSITWSGKSTPVSYTVDIDNWYSNRTPLDSTGIDFPAYSDLMDSFDQYYPLYGFSWGPLGGYQELSPFRFGGGAGTNPNYGRYIAQQMGVVCCALATDFYSESETKAIATRMVQHGIEWGDPLLYSGTGVGPDGGHFQFHISPVLFALSLTGRSDEYNDIMSEAPGNWDQAFEITTADKASDFTNHTDLQKPATWRERTLSTQPGGSVVRIPVTGSGSGGDFYQTNIPEGGIATRISDGQTAVVQTEIALNDSGFTLTEIDVQLTAASPFSSGDVIYFDTPEGWVPVGDYDWGLRGGFSNLTGQPWKYSPARGNFYRDLQAWTGQVFALYSMGIQDTLVKPVLGYAYRSHQADNPSADNDYPTTGENWSTRGGDSVSTGPDFYDTYGEQIARQYLDFATVKNAGKGVAALIL